MLSTRMTPELFAAMLNSWLSPGVLARVAEDLDRGGYEEGNVRLLLTSLGMKSAAGAGLDLLADQYLAHFHVPADLVEIARLYRPKIADEVWQQLRSTRFTGHATYDTGEMIDGRGPVVVEVNAPEQDARLVWWPLHVLTDIVGQLAIYWQGVAQQRRPETVHHDHRCEWLFLSWIDMIVGRANGFHLVGQAAMTRTRYDYDVSSIGRFCSAKGALPLDPEDQEQLQVVATLLHKDHPDYFDPPVLRNA